MTSYFDTNKTLTAIEALQIVVDPYTYGANLEQTVGALYEALDLDDVDVEDLEEIPASALEDRDVRMSLLYELAQGFCENARDARFTIMFDNGTQWAIDRWPGGGWQWSYALDGGEFQFVDDSLRIHNKVVGEIGEASDDDVDAPPLELSDIADKVEAGVLEMYKDGGVGAFSAFEVAGDDFPDDFVFTSIEISTPAQRSF